MDRFTVGNKHNKLSNFYEYGFRSKLSKLGENYTWPTAEHFFQAHKTLDEDVMLAIASASSPGQAKRMGRRVDLREDWEAVKLPVMAAAIDAKFSVETIELDGSPSQFLVNTGDDILIEGNDWGDVFWGKCNGRGQNWLGKLLMARRSELRYEMRKGR